jgi:hypothetical protein
VQHRATINLPDTHALAQLLTILTPPHPGGGALAIGGLTPGEAAAIDRLMPQLWAAGRELSHTELRTARGPPSDVRYQRVRVLTQTRLRQLGIDPDAAARLIAYGLPDGSGNGLIILVANRVPPVLLDQVLDYEETHRLHLHGPTTETTRQHDAIRLIRQVTNSTPAVTAIANHVRAGITAAVPVTGWGSFARAAFWQRDLRAGLSPQQRAEHDSIAGQLPLFPNDEPGDLELEFDPARGAGVRPLRIDSSAARELLGRDPTGRGASPVITNCGSCRGGRPIGSAAPTCCCPSCTRSPRWAPPSWARAKSSSLCTPARWWARRSPSSPGTTTFAAPAARPAATNACESSPKPSLPTTASILTSPPD